MGSFLLNAEHAENAEKYPCFFSACPDWFCQGGLRDLSGEKEWVHPFSHSLVGRGMAAQPERIIITSFKEEE
jgi:hypothetical protein